MNPDQFSETSFFEVFLANLRKLSPGNCFGIVTKKRENGIGRLNSDDGHRSGKLGADDFQWLACVGQGGFSTVYQCRKKGTNDIFAIKVITKNRINSRKRLKSEKDILTKLDHPFMVKLHYSFQTKTKIYLLFDLINGGDLFFHLRRQGAFSEELARICIAEIVCAVAHLHKIGIIHRDLKPENILLDSEGHVKLTDFGLSKEVDDSTRSDSFCGTLQYMAPEIILGTGHGKPADWWSVGVVLYEMLTGNAPFSSPNRLILQEMITGTDVHLPTHLTSEAVTLLQGLLQKDPSKRLGSGPEGADEIMHHQWFKEIDWKKVMTRELQPKFKPSVNGVQCTANFVDFYEEMMLQDSFACSRESEDNMFMRGFTYVAPDT